MSKNPIQDLDDFVRDLRYAPNAAIEDDYERGYRHAEDDIKRKLLTILDRLR